MKRIGPYPAALGLVFLMWIALVSGPARAMLPETTEAAPASTPEPALTIEMESDPRSDTRIATRIRGIFQALPSLRSVSVEVSEGVVSLGGTVTDLEDKDRAETIASRVSGVVTVENGIERSLSVDRGLGGLEGKIAALITMLPLAGVALLVALLIGGAGYALASLTGLWRRLAPNSFLAELIASAIRFVFVIVGVVVALDMIGASALLGAVLGGAGVIGIALGFAMRDTIENYVASLMLSVRQPFRANDHVLIDDREGRVIRLTSRATVLMTLDGNHLRIPNGQVFKAVIVNFTRNPQRRFEFELGIDADDDPNAARKLGRETLASLPFVLADPPPEGRTEAVGDSNIVIKFLGWIDQREADWFKARSRAIAAVKQALEEAGFGLPEPIYRLRFDSRTQPLPFENIAETKRQSAEKPKPAAIAVTELDNDVRPRGEIAEMVERERSEESDERDLLDSGRPVE